MGVFASFTVDAVQFNCSFYIQSYIVAGNDYTCDPKVTLSGSTILKNVTGVHKTGFSNDDVECLWIFDQNLPFFPHGIEEFFKNLKAVYVYNSLLSISAEDLRQFPNLEHFRLFKNNLPSLDGDLFSFNPLLKYIDMTTNGIQHIGHDLVTHLNNLEELYLYENICISRTAYTRAAVVELAAKLSVLCPPLDESTSIATTTTVPTATTTTEQPITKCSCDDEIDQLRDENQLQNEAIAKLQQSNGQLSQANEKLSESNAEVEKRLLEVEMKLREISSGPCSN